MDEKEYLEYMFYYLCKYILGFFFFAKLIINYLSTTCLIINYLPTLILNHCVN